MNVSQITRDIYLGSAPETVDDIKVLAGLNVVSIIDCREEASDGGLIGQSGLGFAFLHDGVPDWTPKAAIGEQPLPFSFFNEARMFWQPDHITFLHCSLGLNRSVTLTYYLLRLMGLFPDDARYILNDRRLVTDWWDTFDQTWRQDAENALRTLIVG